MNRRNWRTPELRNQIASITDLIETKQKLYETVNIKLDVASNDVPHSFEGDFFYVLSAPSTVDCQVRFNEHDAHQISIKKGFRFQTPFHTIYFTNTAQTGTVITLLIGKDLAFDFAELGVVNVDTINNPVSLSSSSTVWVNGSPRTIDDTVGGTLLLGTVYSRMEVVIFNEGANPCRVGLSDVTFAGGAGAAGGLLLNPGASMTTRYTGAIYAICDAGLITKLSYWDEWR